MRHYEELRDAIATGAAEIAFEDKRIRYHGHERMKRLLAEMESYLGITTPGGSSKGARTPRFNNGL
ncbi:MAG: hypothetical protein AAFU73_23440 [Planctomycetota bacterium]